MIYLIVCLANNKLNRWLIIFIFYISVNWVDYWLIVVNLFSFFADYINFRSTELEFNLTETGLDEIDPDKIWGQIYLTVNLVPRTQEEKEQVM